MLHVQVSESRAEAAALRARPEHTRRVLCVPLDVLRNRKERGASPGAPPPQPAAPAVTPPAPACPPKEMAPAAAEAPFGFVSFVHLFPPVAAAQSPSQPPAAALASPLPPAPPHVPPTTPARADAAAFRRSGSTGQIGYATTGPTTPRYEPTAGTRRRGPADSVRVAVVVLLCLACASLAGWKTPSPQLLGGQAVESCSCVPSGANGSCAYTTRCVITEAVNGSLHVVGVDTGGSGYESSTQSYYAFDGGGRGALAFRYSTGIAGAISEPTPACARGVCALPPPLAWRLARHGANTSGGSDSPCLPASAEALFSAALLLCVAAQLIAHAARRTLAGKGSAAPLCSGAPAALQASRSGCQLCCAGAKPLMRLLIALSCLSVPSAGLVARTSFLTNTMFGGTTACTNAAGTAGFVNSVLSPNGAWQLIYQTDTNLVIYKVAGNVATGSCTGNFCDYAGNGNGAVGYGWLLCLDSDGHVRVYGGGTKTAGDPNSGGSGRGVKYTAKNWVAASAGATLSLFIDDAGALTVGDPNNNNTVLYTIYSQSAPAGGWSPPPPPSPSVRSARAVRRAGAVLERDARAALFRSPRPARPALRRRHSLLRFVEYPRPRRATHTARATHSSQARHRRTPLRSAPRRATTATRAWESHTT